jgi:endosialidase-like protein
LPVGRPRHIVRVANYPKGYNAPHYREWTFRQGEPLPLPRRHFGGKTSRQERTPDRRASAWKESGQLRQANPRRAVSLGWHISFGSAHHSFAVNNIPLGKTVNGTFVSASDRNSKENFAAVDGREVLAKVAALPIATWNYKQDTGTRHLGPMAQDFYAAFAVGSDDKHIAVVDEGGVALAAIQGLSDKVESGKQKSETRIEKLETENAELRSELGELKSLVKSMNEKLNGGAK